jgi:4-oxalocrotonate tautomerase
MRVCGSRVADARSNTMVLVDEVADGGWGIGGTVLTREMLRT